MTEFSGSPAPVEGGPEQDRLQGTGLDATAVRSPVVLVTRLRRSSGSGRFPSVDDRPRCERIRKRW